ncbi:hypothetical protein B0A55_06270 [Friedmanniomyces simplex]|uniref:Uncharacterized protein n=1 Tax=Friedmanniomyces simplex TaxID=329884 RepID=A0A4V5NHJ5_9PEZI|nr:hypothetical protein B0A55_06270 [Friedmanniomyces simplex]
MKNLASTAAAEAAVKARKNSWGTWFLSPLYKQVDESEDENRTRDREAGERLEKEKVEEERLARIWKQQQEQREKQAQEAREVLRKQQAEPRAAEFARQEENRRLQKVFVDEMERRQRNNVHSSFDHGTTRQAYASACSHDGCLDGELTWRHLLNHLEKDAEHRYFRLNVQFGDQEPRLDDIGAMEKLSQDVNLSKNDQQLTEIKLALLASSFFFELKRAPKFDASGFYICQGEIRVRGDHTKVFMALRQMSNGPIEFRKDGVPLGKADHSTDAGNDSEPAVKQWCKRCKRPHGKVCWKKQPEQAPAWYLANGEASKHGSKQEKEHRAQNPI